MSDVRSELMLVMVLRSIVGMMMSLIIFGLNGGSDGVGRLCGMVLMCGIFIGMRMEVVVMMNSVMSGLGMIFVICGVR